MAIFTVLLGSLLDIGLVSAASVRTSTQMLLDKNYKTLQMEINTDIQVMEKSITALQDSLSSLAEVVL